MGRTKAVKPISIVSWLSANRDCREGRFIQVGNSLLLSPEFHKLKSGAQMLYLCAAMESGGGADFKFSHTTAKKYGISYASFDRYRDELVKYGFIERTDDENHEQYKPSKYRFCFTWKR